ncbi:MAG TPA: hypothetical protein VIQ60_10670 [Gemmatimonadaceae bacterium]
MMMNRHLSDGTLRALDDGELSLLETLRSRIHLTRCGRCRATLSARRSDQLRAQELLSMIDRPVDTADAWRRFSARRPDTSPRTQPFSARFATPQLAWTMTAALAVVATALAIGRGNGASATVAGPGRQDVCCWDLDGGGPSDDGVMTISREGEMLDCVVLYDDLDRSRSFSYGDAVRYMSRPESCGLTAGLIPTDDVHGTMFALSTMAR